MYRRKERPASGPLVEAGWCTAVQRLGRSGCVQCTVGVHRDCGGTEETLWHQSHWSESEERSGDQSQSDVKMWGREQ